jgi:DNA polymerase
MPALDLSGIGRPARPEPTALGHAAPAATTAVVTGAETPEERRVKLAVIADEVASCTRCGLHATRTQTVFARGNPLAELCFVGEGPGADEDAQGLPFVGKAGQLLDKMIAAMGYERDEVYICNIVKCRPPENRKPEPSEIASCQPYLTAQLGLLRPRVIVALGATAVQGLTGTGEGITRMRGKWKLYKGTTPIMPTFHPAYLLRQPEAKRDVWSDLQLVMKFLGKSPPAKGAS